MEEVKPNNNKDDLPNVGPVKKKQDDKSIKLEEVVIDIKDNKLKTTYIRTDNYYKDIPLCKLDIR